MLEGTDPVIESDVELFQEEGTKRVSQFYTPDRLFQSICIPHQPSESPRLAKIALELNNMHNLHLSNLYETHWSLSHSETVNEILNIAGYTRRQKYGYSCDC